MTRYASFVEKTRAAVVESDGHLDAAVRGAIVRGQPDSVPAELLAYVEKVRSQAFAITDADVESLKRAGYTEDQIFEATAGAALGAALLRLQRGMAALQGQTS